MPKKESKKDKKSKDTATELPSALGAFKQEAFVETLKDTSDLMLFKCTSCGGVHFRHAGYVESMTPYISLMPKGAREVKSSTVSLPVKVCVACKHSFVDVQGKMQDVTEFIDLNAWERTEKEAQKATGPGGQC